MKNQNKNLKIYIIVLNVLFIIAVLSSCDPKGWRQVQKEQTYENVNSRWKKDALKNAREVAKQRDKAKKDSIKHAEFLEKLEAIRKGSH